MKSELFLILLGLYIQQSKIYKSKTLNGGNYNNKFGFFMTEIENYKGSIYYLEISSSCYYITDLFIKYQESIYKDEAYFSNNTFKTSYPYKNISNNKSDKYYNITFYFKFKLETNNRYLIYYIPNSDSCDSLEIRGSVHKREIGSILIGIICGLIIFFIIAIFVICNKIKRKSKSQSIENPLVINQINNTPQSEYISTLSTPEEPYYLTNQ